MLALAQPEIEPNAGLEQAAESARAFLRQAKDENTVRAYHSDWRHFTVWCREHERTGRQKEFGLQMDSIQRQFDR